MLRTEPRLHQPQPPRSTHDRGGTQCAHPPAVVQPRRSGQLGSTVEETAVPHTRHSTGPAQHSSNFAGPDASASPQPLPAQQAPSEAFGARAGKPLAPAGVPSSDRPVQVPGIQGAPGRRPC
jgi:hypothetical protein